MPMPLAARERRTRTTTSTMTVEPGLWPKSPGNGNIRGRGWRLSTNWPLIFRSWGLGDRCLNRESPPVAGLSPLTRDPFFNAGTAWLGREDSNLRMVESKSANGLNDINGHSEKRVDYSLKCINSLANDSE